MPGTQRIQSRFFWGWLLLILAACRQSPVQITAPPTPANTPTPVADRLAEPPLPEHPTQLDEGRHLYWLHCMPCHGDQGQGLTDEFRALWVEDHQNCWARGCHTGRPGDEGFPIPRTIPAIVAAPGATPLYESAEELADYLRTTHPPQEPGRLSSAECEALAAFILLENDCAAEHEQE